MVLTRALVIAAVLTASATAVATPRALVVVIDNHSGMLGARFAMAKQAVSNLSVERGDALYVVSGDGFGRTLMYRQRTPGPQALRSMKRFGVGDNHTMKRALLKALAILRGHKRAERLVVVIGSSPEPLIPAAPGHHALHMAGIGLSYINLDPSLSLPSVWHPLDRWYVAGSQAALRRRVIQQWRASPVSTLVLRGAGRGKPAAVLLVAPWWKSADPCPRGSSLRKRQDGGGKEQACRGTSGEIHGRRTVWTAAGMLVSDATYRHGSLHGLRRRWYPTGLLESYEEFRRGKRQGYQRAWTGNGVLVLEQRYRQGRKHGIGRQWNAKGERLADARHRDGRPVGTWIVSHSDGADARASYRRGTRHGVYIERGKNGAILVRGRYEQGRKTGLWRVWRDNGTKVSEGAYRRGRRHGPWKIYRADGQLRRKDVYRDGALERTHWF